MTGGDWQKTRFYCGQLALSANRPLDAGRRNRRTRDSNESDPAMNRGSTIGRSLGDRSEVVIVPEACDCVAAFTSAEKRITLLEVGCLERAHESDVHKA